MKVQRYDVYGNNLTDESKNGDWVKYEVAAKLKKRVEELEKVLREIGDFDCNCFEDDSCAACLAQLALEAT
jgi:hypothetical protein